MARKETTRIILEKHSKNYNFNKCKANNENKANSKYENEAWDHLIEYFKPKKG